MDHTYDDHDINYRINPSGHKELVAKRGEDDEEEMLNELSDELAEEIGAYCEGCGLPYPNEKYCGNCRAGVTGPLAHSVSELDEAIEFSGPLPTGGGAGSPEQLQYQRNTNQPDAPIQVGSSGDQSRNHGESPNNLTGSTRRDSDGPERSRSKSNLKANAKGNIRTDKYITRPVPDGLDHGVTRNESFTGTGAIAIAPGFFSSGDGEEEEEEEEDTNLSEFSMSNKTTINEWEPTFKSAGYEPGDHQMPSPPGDGVAKRKPKRSNVGKYETDTSKVGEAWPGQHNDTPAMCDVDDDGVENKPQGSHESSVGNPDDGHQSKMGHDWPDDAKNSGSGVAEPFKGDRWSDGGTLKGSGANDDHYSPGGPGMPSDGPIKGTSGPQLGQPQESWDPNTIGALMEDNEIDLQNLFDNYAKQVNYVDVPDFQELCNAHGLDITLNEQSLITLMDQNNELMFLEGQDASGVYWVGTPIHETEACAKCGCDPCECDDEDCMEEGRKHKGTISEYSRDMRPGMDTEDNIDSIGINVDLGDMESGLGDVGGPRDTGLGGMDNIDELGGMGAECPQCGTPSEEETCPECGAEMMDELGDMDGSTSPRLSNVSLSNADDMRSARGASRSARGVHPRGNHPEGGTFESTVVSPKIVEGLQNFMRSAKKIIARNPGFQKKSIGEALQISWRYHAGGIDPNKTPSKIQSSLRTLMQQYPTFAPIREEGRDVMDNLGGSAISDTNLTSSSHLNEKDTPGPDDMDDHGDPFGGKQENTLDDTPIIKGTEKGMSGTGSQAKSVKENVSRLAKYLRGPLQEATKGIDKRYRMTYSLLVQETNDNVLNTPPEKRRCRPSRNRTPVRATLAECLADAEELLQIHPYRNVMLEARVLSSQSNKVIRKHDFPLVKVKKRGPLVSEGLALFRFKRHADNFANELVTEGATCRLIPHNWGHAVSARVNYKLAKRAFQNLNESYG